MLEVCKWTCAQKPLVWGSEFGDWGVKDDKVWDAWSRNQGVKNLGRVGVCKA